jgi:hypothetical protein
VDCETEHEREARLADMRIRAQDRINNESECEREARLADMRIRAQERVANETQHDTNQNQDSKHETKGPR